MRINLAMGFLLPVPPAAGGATEKIWLRLAEEFTAQGHDVTILSRQWQDWPQRETQGRLTHLRLRGFDHRPKLWQNLLLDALWSTRVWRALPPSDVTIVHTVALPILLGWRRGTAGKVVVVPGRMPKGQYRWYRHVDGVFATSTAVRQRVIAENPALAERAFVRGNPIDWRALAAAQAPRNPRPIVGFVGRLNRAKGLDLLASAMELLARDTALPDFELVLAGPVAIAQGGSGPDYAAEIERRLRAALPTRKITVHPPIYDAARLAALYGRIDIFCYPSVDTGEAFGVAIAEAMAAGSACVVSKLECFRDLSADGENALVFDHAAPDAVAQLAAALRSLLADSVGRAALASRGQAEVVRYDYPRFAATLLDDFRALQSRLEK